MIAYKVVSIQLKTGNRVSAVAAHWNGVDSKVVYEKDKPTIPDAGWGPLAAFPFKHDAEEFAAIESYGLGRSFEIWECEVIQDTANRALWNCTATGRRRRTATGYDLPRGTTFCLAIVLRECLAVYKNGQKIKS